MSLFWSIRPFEQVMETLPCAAENVRFEEIQTRGITMLVSNLGQNVRVERIISPNPSHYLLADFQPGVVLSRKSL